MGKEEGSSGYGREMEWKRKWERVEIIIGKI